MSVDVLLANTSDEARLFLDRNPELSGKLEIITLGAQLRGLTVGQLFFTPGILESPSGLDLLKSANRRRSWLAVPKPAPAATPAQKPTIGSVVHYQSYGTPNGEYLPEPRAAIITCTYPEDEPPELADPSKLHVGLVVLNPTGMFFNQLVPYAETPTPGHWNWPPRT